MKKYMIVGILLMGVIALGHGEDKPGPHGGYISMPGAFHVEILPVGKHKLKVYLLDINWKNPSVKQSLLEVTFTNGKTTAAECVQVQTEYLCTFDPSVDLNSHGKVLVKASREKQKGVPVEYITPFRFEK